MATAGRILIIPRGKYNEESTYDMLDMVSFGGKGWICKKPCIGIEPIEGEYWAECIDMSYEFEDLEKKSNPLKAVYIDEIDEALDSTTPEYPYIIGHSVMLEELGVGSLVSVEILSPSEDYICQNAVGESGTASRLYDSEKGWGEWFVNAKTDDITTTTETTMPNSCEGRLLFKKIGGKTERLMSNGKNLIDFRNSNASTTGGGVTYTLQPDGSFKRTGTATSVAGNVWIMGGYNLEPNETNTIYHLEAGETYVGSDCMFFSKDISFYLNPPTYIDPAKNPNGINITGIKNASFEVGKTYNDTVYPMLCKYSEDNEWEPYDGGTPKPFIRSARIRGIKTHGKNWFDKNNVKNFNGYIDNETFVSHASHKTLCIPCQPNTDYTVSKISSLRFSIAFSSEIPNGGVPVTNRVQNNTGTVLTSNSGENGKYLLVWYYIENDSDINAILDSIQIEVGTVATEYKPYKESVITLPQPITLDGIGDVQDAVEGGKTTREFAKVVFDGVNERLTLESNSNFDSVTRFSAFLTDAKRGKPNALCSHARYVADYTANYEHFYLLDRYLYIFISNDIATTEDTINEWLKDNHITVIYELAEPITEELPTADQIALNSLDTFDGTTHLEFDSPLLAEFIAEYGISKIGGYTLEGMLTGRNGELMGKDYANRLASLETAMVNNI